MNAHHGASTHHSMAIQEVLAENVSLNRAILLLCKHLAFVPLAEEQVEILPEDLLCSWMVTLQSNQNTTVHEVFLMNF